MKSDSDVNLIKIILGVFSEIIVADAQNIPEISELMADKEAREAMSGLSEGVMFLSSQLAAFPNREAVEVIWPVISALGLRFALAGKKPDRPLNEELAGRLFLEALKIDTKMRRSESR